MDELVGKFAKRLSLEHFADLLDLASNGLSEPGLNLQELVDLVAAATLLLQNAPEGLSLMIVFHGNLCCSLRYIRFVEGHTGPLFKLLAALRGSASILTRGRAAREGTAFRG